MHDSHVMHDTVCTPHEFVLAHICLSSLVCVCSCLYTLFLLMRIHFQSYALCASIFTGTCLFSLVHIHSYFCRLNLNPTRSFSTVHGLRPPAPTCTRLHLYAFICANLQSFMSLFSTVRTRLQWYTFISDGSHLTLTLFS